MSRCLAEIHRGELLSLQLALKTSALADFARSGNFLAVRMLLEDKVNPDASSEDILNEVADSFERDLSEDWREVVHVTTFLNGTIRI